MDEWGSCHRGQGRGFGKEEPGDGAEDGGNWESRSTGNHALPLLPEAGTIIIMSKVKWKYLGKRIDSA